MRIGIMAPSCRLDEQVAEKLPSLARDAFGADAPEFVIHPQSFLSEGHFAGPDVARADAFVALANDPTIDAIWFARGGYGACRMVDLALPRLASAAGDKAYLGYSDAGFLLAGLYAHGVGRVAHGPMPSDLKRQGGDAAVGRGLAWLMNPAPQTGGQKQAAFNLTVLSQLLGTSLQPDLSGHVLMIEEVGEYMYRIDRSLFHLTSNPGIRQIAGLMLGRCSDIPENAPDFVLTEEEVAQHWCRHAGIPYLGRANIGHDAHNEVIPFGG